MWILIPYTIGLVFAIFLKGGVWPGQWNWIALLLALSSLVWQFTTGRTRSSLRDLRPLEILLLALGVYPLLQIIPLPAGLVQAVSPERYLAAASAAQALNWPSPGHVPLSLSAGATFQMWLAWAPAIVVFLTLRQVCRRADGSRWILVMPVVAIAALEALLGILQWWAGQGANPPAVATGTYVNRNHFAGLLEMAIPLALCAAAASWSARAKRYARPASDGIKAGSLLALVTIMLLAIVLSLSRMGFVATLAAIFIVGVFVAITLPGTRERDFWRRIAPAAAVLCAVLVLGFVLPTNALISRFSDFASGEVSSANRSTIWSDTVPLISAYRWTGCGLGAYQYGLNKWRTAAPMNTVDYAHNDYLQTLAETGIPGFLLAIAVGVMVLWSAARSAFQLQPRNADWWLMVGLLASLSAIAIHSFTDFNLQIPANLLTAAWLAGVVSGLPPATAPVGGAHSQAAAVVQTRYANGA